MNSSILRTLFTNKSNWIRTLPYSISANEKPKNEPKPDALYKTIEVEVRGHEPAVLNSYQWFATFAANELGIKIGRVWEPPKYIEKRQLLKCVHIYGKHRVAYEMRTYFRVIELKHLTGSTADTYLEYIQRNLPEGVAMKVTKHAIERIPDHIKPPVQEISSTIEDNLKEREQLSSN
ncbi:small ribosomal subunit protein uS10m-like [Centruroides vittatus]|uniref:small ribosomal subunit protein uS10m-like n=1 Tax=Centruroides vittatus TaxID=120091 RepID=UPI00350EC5AE